PSRPESSSCSSARGTPGNLPAECPRVLRVEVSVADRRPAAALPAAQLPSAVGPHRQSDGGPHTSSIPRLLRKATRPGYGGPRGRAAAMGAYPWEIKK